MKYNSTHLENNFNKEYWEKVFNKVGEQRMMDLTENINECPEDYDSACYCKECQSCL